MHFRTLVACFLVHCFSFVAETTVHDIRLRDSFLNVILPRLSIASWPTNAILEPLATTFRVTFLFFRRSGRSCPLVIAFVIDVSPGTPEIRGHDRGMSAFSADDLRRGWSKSKRAPFWTNFRWKERGAPCALTFAWEKRGVIRNNYTVTHRPPTAADYLYFTSKFVIFIIDREGNLHRNETKIVGVWPSYREFKSCDVISLWNIWRHKST